MTNDGWGKAWPVPLGSNFDKAADEAMEKASGVPWPNPTKMNNGSTISWELGSKTVIWPTQATQGSQLKSQGSNLVDDQAYLYFQCENCQDILDPHTRSFKTLQDKRHEAGWKVVWNTNGLGYKVYCKKCGDK